MTPRRFLFWLHLSAGMVAGAVILIMSVTGILLGYERQITDWSDRQYFSSLPGSPLSLDALVIRVRDAEGKQPALIRIRKESAAPVEFGFEPNGDALLLDPYTGAVLRKGDDGIRGFFSAVERWHRWLGMTGKHRDWGRTITGACNLAFLVLVATGPFLWWPRNASWSRIKRTLFFLRDQSGRARNFNWHNVAGIWCFVPLLLIVVSGSVMSYSWANNLLYRIAGDEAPKQTRPEGGNRAPRKSKTASEAKNPNFDSLFRRARQQVPGWERITLRVLPGNSPMVFTIETGNWGRPDRRAQLTLNPQTEEVVRWEPFSSYTLGRRLRSWVRFAHTGEAGGFIGQTLAVIASCGATLLVWTGLSLMLARFRAWRTMRRQQPAWQSTDNRYGESLE